MYTLKCRSLNKYYIQGDTTIYAVRDCNLKLREGDFTVIVGASGSGKTTLLHLLAAMETPTSGEVILDGKELYRMNDASLSAFRNRKMGFVFQNFHLLPILTAEENIRMPAVIGNITVSQGYLNDLCESLGINDRRGHLPSELSGGQQQRVAIARAMINRPKILFADEPTGNLDKKTAKELIGYLLQSSKQFSQTVLMVTHDRELIEIADTAYQMDDGWLRQLK